MPECSPGAETLDLEKDFPPVPTAAWEEAIRKELKGADPQKLLWRTEEGIALRPYYRASDIRASVDLPGAAGPWQVDDKFAVGPDAVRADEWHDAGANAVQELAYALSAAVDLLADRPATREIEFVFAVGSRYFIEIAKLRAARLLWARASAAFGAAGAACRMRLVARTSRRNKSVYDVYTNLLRATTEAIAAAVGGCDRLFIEPFGFDPHLAVNVQRILMEEAHFDAVADPAAGSYYVEAATDALARDAWKLFQQVEAGGGCRKALESGSLASALEQSRAALAKGVALRRHTLVGVNNYPDLKEKTSAAAAQGMAVPHRLAEPFERIRERTARHAAKTGRYPKVLLLRHGDVKMRMARANFSLNFFGCAGFDVEEGEWPVTDGADLIVLCSSDPEYLVLAQEICPKALAPVIVAGNPKDQVEALRAAGVAGFIHMGCDAVATLTEWQDRLGMEA